MRIAQVRDPSDPLLLLAQRCLPLTTPDDWEAVIGDDRKLCPDQGYCNRGGLIGCELAENLVSKCQSVSHREAGSSAKQPYPGEGDKDFEHLNDIEVIFLGRVLSRT